MATVPNVSLRSRHSAFVTCSIVLAAASGLLVMHGLSLGEPEPVAMSVASPNHRVAATPAQSASPMPMREHLHALLGCLWLIATAAVAAIALTRWRNSVVRGLRVLALPLNPSSPQRAPPSAERLSLVGISRR